MPRTADALAAALAELPLVVERAGITAGAVALAGYPGGIRPTSTITLAGDGVEGRGESVAWTAGAHARADGAAVPRGAWRLGAWTAVMAGRFADPYERAALEAAVIDLALRQGGTTLFRVAGVVPRPLRYVVSFEKVADPAARARAEVPPIELKVDADPAWDDATWAALAATERVAVLDFKGGGRAPDHERAHAAIPAALIEDPGDGPWSAALRRRVSLDAPVVSAAALDALPVRPAAVNLKPARMGGVLEALRCAARCAERGIAVYVGGMFEVGVGRRQLHALAALLCPDAPNDVAPLVPPTRPPRLDVDADAPGFG